MQVERARARVHCWWCSASLLVLDSVAPLVLLFVGFWLVLAIIVCGGVPRVCTCVQTFEDAGYTIPRGANMGATCHGIPVDGCISRVCVDLDKTLTLHMVRPLKGVVL